MTNKDSPSALVEALARARALSAELNEATDELNSSLADAEKAIAELELGVTASVVMETDQNWSSLLAFGKEKQEWKLLYLTGFENDEDWVSTPLLNASRMTRLKAVDFLPLLVEKLVETAGSEVELVQTKAKAVRFLTSRLRKTKQGDPPVLE